MNKLYARIFALVFVTTVSFAVNAAQEKSRAGKVSSFDFSSFDINSKKAQEKKFTPGALLMTTGVMLKTTGNEKLNKAGNVGIETGATATIAAVTGGTTKDVFVAIGIDGTLQLGTYCLRDNEYLQSIGKKIPGAESKEGRANYRAFASVALARIISWLTA